MSRKHPLRSPPSVRALKQHCSPSAPGSCHMVGSVKPMLFSLEESQTETR